MRLACGSLSISSTFFPSRAKPMPRLAQVVVLPTPPFWLAIAIICVLIFTSLVIQKRDVHATERLFHHTSLCECVFAEILLKSRFSSRYSILGLTCTSAQIVFRLGPIITRSSRLNSIAGETTEFAKPVIGTMLPAPAYLPIRS